MTMKRESRKDWIYAQTTFSCEKKRCFEGSRLFQGTRGGCREKKR